LFSVTLKHQENVILINKFHNTFLKTTYCLIFWFHIFSYILLYNISSYFTYYVPQHTWLKITLLLTQHI
jgi:hypothetical protein